MGSVLQSIEAKRIAVCVGSGGVGKTTVAAAIALDRAMRGGRALVCTFDPARRLANALGLESLGNVEAHVAEHKFAEAGLRPKGQLFAMMLDVKRTWDDLIARHAPDRARLKRILDNRIYQQLSTVLAGSQEYMAMEKLYELATERSYDLVVLDTPPTAHALDFLDAPDRILDFLGNDTARSLLAPAGRMGFKLFQLGGSYVAKTLARFTGADVLSDLAEFMATFQGMYDGFKERATAVHELFSRPDVGFVLVASPSPRSIDEALFFHERLHAESMPIAGAVANRVTRDLWPEGMPVPAAAELADALAASHGVGLDDLRGLAERLALTIDEHQRVARVDLREIERLFRGVGGARAAIPRLETDVHDLGGLALLAERL